MTKFFFLCAFALLSFFCSSAAQSTFSCRKQEDACIKVQSNGTTGFCILAEDICTSYIEDSAGICECTSLDQSILIQTSAGTVGDTVTCNLVLRTVIQVGQCFDEVIALDNDVPPTSPGTTSISATQQKEFVFKVSQPVKIGKLRLRMAGFDNGDNSNNIIGLYSKPDASAKTTPGTELTFYGNPVPAPDGQGLLTQFEFTPFSDVTFGPGQFSILITAGGGSDFNLIFEAGNPMPTSNSSVAESVGYYFYNTNTSPDYGPSSLYNSLTLFMTA